MAFGFPASYETEVAFMIDRAIACDAIASTLEELGWGFKMPSAHTFVARSGISGASWGETITISLLNNETLRIRSACYFQIIDWGKNRRNVNQFLELFLAKVRRAEFPNTGHHAYLDASGNSPLDRLLKDEDAEQAAVSSYSTPDSP